MTTRRIFTIAVMCCGLAQTSAAEPSAQRTNPKQRPLTFCAVPAAAPRVWRTADGSPHGLDVEVAKLVCRRLGRKFTIHWCASAACSRRCLREGRCDVVIGLPHDPGLWRDAAWSVPYSGSQFGLVVSEDAKGGRSLGDLRGKRVGIVSGTVPLSESDHVVLRFKTRNDVLDGFRQAKLDAAFMDADFAQWRLHKNPQLKLRLAAGFIPRQRWNMAMAVRAKDAALLVAINRALSQITESGEIRKAYAAHGVSYRPPFTNTARRKVKYNTWKQIRERGRLVVSMDPANLPYSSAKKTLPGFDVEIARALARELGVKLQLEWIDVNRETALGHLLEYECDLAFGAAIDPNAVDDEEELAGKVIYSRPYYGTGYLLVNRKGGPRVRSLAELKGAKSRRLGTEAGSVADYNLRQRGYLRRLYRNQLAVLNDLNEGGIDYAYLWTNVGWTLHNSPEFKLEITPNYVPEDRWNIAVAMRNGDDELKRHVDAALAKLITKGEVARALARYHVPFFPPFEKEEKDAGVIHRGPVKRGLEPQFARKQTSKNPYGGLERIRSAGTLVVGLDHNNLPFSAVHPKPAGLDYDIARLLAKELGVSLRVYWAYSQHDSYPSKLAKRNLCDVIMGVMPDDRFGKRVLYSLPYYAAKYQFVVAATSDFERKKLMNTPVAVETGVAVRGLPERLMLPYPNLEAILASVASGKAKAGYVISTRGHWLAHKHWPGKLKFVDAPSASDRFPICVAVRKTDADLKIAIDQALDRLASSGRLADVFARWHIPYASPNNNGAKSSK